MTGPNDGAVTTASDFTLRSLMTCSPRFAVLSSRQCKLKTFLRSKGSASTLVLFQQRNE
jgi:hypothetical protein